MITVLLKAAATARYRASQPLPPPSGNPHRPNTATPSRHPPTIWTSAVTVMDLPAATIFFRSISSPIMKSRKIRPSSAMVSIASASWTQRRQAGPSRNPPTR